MIPKRKLKSRINAFYIYVEEFWFIIIALNDLERRCL